MALSTQSKFYYGIEVTENNRYIDMVLLGVPITTTLNIGNYSPETLVTELTRALLSANAAGNYNISFDRVNKKLVFTIDDVYTDEYYFLFGSGANSGKTAATLLGFDAIDFNIIATTSSTYTVCKEYKTQFPIQSFLSYEHNKKARLPVLNTATSGVVELVKFGNDRFLEGELMFITDVHQGEAGIIRNNVNGVSDYISLIEWLIEKAPVEIMTNENDVNDYRVFILESTDASSNGLDYELIELYDRGLPLYYRSGLLKFKLME